MAKKNAQNTSSAPVAESSKRGFQEHHTAFSHVMYALFLVSVTFAMVFTFQALGAFSDFSNSEYFYPVLSIMMLMWAFLFWEWGHRIHVHA